MEPVVTLSATNVFGDTVTLEVVAFGEPATNATGAIKVALPATAVMVLLSAFFEVSVVAARPLPSVLGLGVATTSLPLLLLNATAWPITALAYASRINATAVAAALPLATRPLGDTASDDCVAFGEPAVPITSVVTDAVPTCAVIVFVSALLVLSVVV